MTAYEMEPAAEDEPDMDLDEVDPVSDDDMFLYLATSPMHLLAIVDYYACAD